MSFLDGPSHSVDLTHPVTTLFWYRLPVSLTEHFTVRANLRQSLSPHLKLFEHQGVGVIWLHTQCLAQSQA